MAINEGLLAEYDHEMNITRKFIELVPFDKLSWKPHPKSMPLGQLAVHIVETQGWTVETFKKSSFDVAPPGGPAYKSPEFKNREEMLAAFDNNVKRARQAIQETNDAEMMQPWSLLNAGTPMFTMPKLVVFKGFILKHTVHHRAQLGMYYRLNDLPVPATYGPSADETTM